MKIEATYQITLYYDDVDLTEDEVKSMSNTELADFANNMQDRAIPNREEQDGMIWCGYITDDGRQIKEI